jgi:chromosome segregation ATPase
MSSITRGILRYGVIGGLALGGVTLLVGPERVAAGLAQVRVKAQNVVDSCVDDPMALRRQLEQLADEYPDRIAEVRGEIAEVTHQIGQFDRDIAIAEQVVLMTTNDLQEFKTLVTRAEAEARTTTRPISIRHDGVRYDIEEAYDEGRRINNVRGTYQDRLSHDAFQLKLLNEQKDRLTEILIKMEGEYSTYQSKLWQLDRQIDAVQRNERLIKLTEEQQATLESYNRFGKIRNLKQLEAKLAEIRAFQQAQLETLEKRGVHYNYEEAARLQLDSDGQVLGPFDTIIEIELDEDPQEGPPADRSVVWAGPKIIE